MESSPQMNPFFSAGGRMESVIIFKTLYVCFSNCKTEACPGSKVISNTPKNKEGNKSSLIPKMKGKHHLDFSLSAAVCFQN
jgi:hypothetical protein